MAIQLDGNANATKTANNAASHSTIAATGLSTNASAGLVYVVALGNPDTTAGISSISASAGTFAGFAERTHSGTGTGNNIHIWSSTFSGGALSSVDITVTYSASMNFSTISVFAIAGNDTGSIYDGDASIPGNNTTGTLTFSTTNANDLVVAGYRFGATASPTEGSGGWTKIHGVNFLLTEYQVYSATQSGTTATIGTGDTDENGGVVDAVKQGAGSWGSLISDRLSRLVIA